MRLGAAPPLLLEAEGPLSSAPPVLVARTEAEESLGASMYRSPPSACFFFAAHCAGRETRRVIAPCGRVESLQAALGQLHFYLFQGDFF